VTRVENRGIFHRRRFAAEDAEVVEEIVASKLCVLCGECFPGAARFRCLKGSGESCRAFNDSTHTRKVAELEQRNSESRI